MKYTKIMMAIENNKSICMFSLHGINVLKFTFQKIYKGRYSEEIGRFQVH